MKFEETGLPKHPEIERAFGAMQVFYAPDKTGGYAKEAVTAAKFLTDNLANKEPSVIAAGLLWEAIAGFGADFSKQMEGALALNYAAEAAQISDAGVNRQAKNPVTASLVLAGFARIADDALQNSKMITRMNPIDLMLYTGHKERYLKDLKEIKKEIGKVTGPLKKHEPALVKVFDKLLADAMQAAAAPQDWSPETKIRFRMGM